MTDQFAKVAVIIVFLLSMGAVGAELKGELEGPRVVPNRKRGLELEYTCTTLANEDEARTVRFRLKPRGRLMKVYLGKGVTVEGTAHRTRVPAEGKVYYTLLNSLEKYKFKLVFSTNRIGNQAELRLVSGEDAIVCAFHPEEAEISE